MCGISGYIGNYQATPFLIEMLKRLEYRGYDSAGIATVNNDRFEICKATGELKNLILKLKNGNICDGNIGIGHTRWATHGNVSIVNAHPHCTKRLGVVHNGVITNYMDLKNKFLDPSEITTDTDTEVIVRIIDKFIAEGENTKNAIKHFMSLAEGSWAIALVDLFAPNKIYVSKNKSPLIIGSGTDYNMIASDVSAVCGYTNKIYSIDDMEIAEVSSSEVNIYDFELRKVIRKPYMPQIANENVALGEYPHYMLKEIEEQPSVIRRISEYYNQNSKFSISGDVLKLLRGCENICMVACGSSYHASLVGSFYFEKISSKNSSVYIASEFIYNMPIIKNKTVYIFVSQSGETADCITALKMVKKSGCTAFAIINSCDSTLSRMADYSFYLCAGIEVSVASTKTYMSQLSLFLILASAIIDKTTVFDDLLLIADNVENICLNKEAYQKVVKMHLKSKKHCFFIGRNLDYYAAMEASLKLKEVSYIHSEAIAAGELKHGSLALIEKDVVVFAINTQSSTKLCTDSNIKETLARGATVVDINAFPSLCGRNSIKITESDDMHMPFIIAPVTQLIAYYAAVQNDCEIDKPRNLAKSVTVE